MNSFNLERRRIDAKSRDELFAEMERIWGLLGHRPSRIEWESSRPAIAYITYRRQFGGWSNACAAFVDHMMGVRSSESTSTYKATEPKLGVRRDVPLKLRLKILERDGYRCVLCGRSPAIERGVILHLDHVVPVAEGGKGTFENLRTLCASCNFGKGASQMSPNSA